MLSNITTYLASTGCKMPDIALLQRADPFLDTTGEDLRRRIFITRDTTGANLCLRPEFTIPVCLNHLEEDNAPSRYAYGGTVFRQRDDAPVEFTQAGFEDLGSQDRQQADANCIQTALDVMAETGQHNVQLVVGDQSVFLALLDALEIPPAWHKRLVRAFGDDDLLRQNLAALSGEQLSKLELPLEILKYLDAAEPLKLVEAVTDHMISDGLPLSGGRTPQAIAERIMEKHQLQATRLEAEKREILEAFLAIDVPLSDAGTTLQQLAATHGLNLEEAIAPIAALADSLKGSAPDARYRAGFGRRLDYYTGLVFEIFGANPDKPIIGGGRYDRLLSMLGASEEIPAVGFAVWVDRLEVQA